MIFHIYAIYGMQQILLNFVFMHTTAVHNFQVFVFKCISKLHAKMTNIHANIMKKI